MVTELDFEELDGLMGQMSDAQSLTDAIAADVAKVSGDKKPKKTKATQKTVKKPVKSAVKKVDNNAIVATVEEPESGVVIAKKSPEVNKPKVITSQDEDMPVKAVKIKHPVKKEQPKPPAPKATDTESENGTRVAVKVLTKYAEEPETPVYKPNPRVGRFMDMVDPKNDMKTPKKTSIPITPITTVVETTQTVVETVEEIRQIPEEDIDDYDRIQKSGLDPEATIEEMMELGEPEEEDQADDEFLEEMMNSLGEDIDSEINEPEITEDESAKAAADILDFPDRSDAFLSNAEIEKRPLGGSAVAASVMMMENDDVTPFSPSITPEKPELNTPETSKISNKELKKSDKIAKKQAKALPSKQKKTSKVRQTLLYFALILLLAILGGSLGALAYFSGLF